MATSARPTPPPEATTPATTPVAAAPGAAPERPGTGRAGLVGLAAWVAVVVVALVWGTRSVRDAGVSLRAAPFIGHWQWDLEPGIVPAVAVGAAVALAGPRVAARARWRAVPWITAVAASTWTAALAASDGWYRLTAPLASRHEYEPLAAGVGDVGAFLRTYTDQLSTYPIHVQGHPPGPVVAAWALDRVGLGGAGWLAVVCLAAWGLAAAAALVAVRAVAGEATARRAAPALAVLPAAVWAGTSFDPVFAALLAGGTALAVTAVTRASDGRAIAAGTVLGCGLLSSYGMAVGLAVPAVALGGLALGGAPRRAVRAGVTAAAAATAVVALAALAGFWWFDGLDATRTAYWDGVGGERPGLYTTVAGNPGALALAVGPAVAAGLAAGCARLRRAPQAAWRPLLLPAAALLAVVVADLSQMSKGEVERIWLPFVPFLALAAPGHRRGWLAAQVAVGLGLQITLASPW